MVSFSKFSLGLNQRGLLESYKGLPFAIFVWPAIQKKETVKALGSVKQKEIQIKRLHIAIKLCVILKGQLQ